MKSSFINSFAVVILLVVLGGCEPRNSVNVGRNEGVVSVEQKVVHSFDWNTYPGIYKEDSWVDSAVFILYETRDLLILKKKYESGYQLELFHTGQDIDIDTWFKDLGDLSLLAMKQGNHYILNEGNFDLNKLLKFLSKYQIK
jgi:hypothetical protein